jgi:hypothetical protein
MARIELDSSERKEKWDEIEFQTIYDRLYTAKVVSSQTELATLLKLGRAAISYVAKKGYVPREWKTRFERAGISWDWVAYGDGGKYNANRLMATGAIVSLQKIDDITNGKVVKSVEVYEYPVHKTFLAQANINPANLGYVVQSGSAMLPSAADGDIWIVDMGNTSLDIGCTYIVKVGQSAQIGARLVVNTNGIDNTATLGHANVSLPQQVVSMDHVEVVGRCVLKVCKVV